MFKRDLFVSGPRSARPRLLQRRRAYPRLRVQTLDPSCAPNTSQPRAPRPLSPSCLCSLLPFPLFSFNMGRLVCEELTLVSPGFLSRNCFSALTLFCHSFFCHSSFSYSSPHPCPLLAGCSRGSVSLTEPLRWTETPNHSVYTNNGRSPARPKEPQALE